MINVIISPNLIMAFFMACGALILMGLRFVIPEISKDTDIVLTTIALLYAMILAIHGWRLDPILLLSQGLLLAAGAVTGWENIHLRGCIYYSYLSRKNRNQNRTDFHRGNFHKSQNKKYDDPRESRYSSSREKYRRDYQDDDYDDYNKKY